MTIAEAIDRAITEVLEINSRADAAMLVDLYDGMPGSVSKEEYVEFVKRNLESNNKLTLENLKEGLR